MKVISFCPAHITGLFKPIIVKNSKPEFTGSIGVGFSIQKGITTFVSVRLTNKTSFRIGTVGYMPDNNNISEFITKEFLKLTDKKYFINIIHQIEVPIGYGLGCSAAVALSLAFALNKALNLKFSKSMVGQIAHKAEIIYNTGLGDVLAVYHGGFEVRTKCGAPGIGSVKKIRMDDSTIVAIICFSSIPTKYIMKNSIKRNYFEDISINKLVKTRNSDDFQDKSIEFARNVNMITPKMNVVVHDLHKNNIKCGIAFFGETVFSILHKDMIKKVLSIMKKYNGVIIKSKIDHKGARIQHVT